MNQFKDFLHRTHHNKLELLLPAEARIIVELPPKEWFEIAQELGENGTIAFNKVYQGEFKYLGITVRQQK
jgi:hypothetical protein